MNVMSGETRRTEGKSGTPGAGGLRDFAAQIEGMIAALWSSHQRTKIIGLFVALVVVVGTTAYMQVRLNAWNQPFYNALAHKEASEFFEQLIVFGELAGILLVLNVAQMWLNQESQLVLRQGLVEDLMGEWLAPHRGFRLTQSGEIGHNPDQRLQQDAQHLTELTTTLGIGLLQSTLLLLSFVGVLWVMSSSMAFSFGGRVFEIPGYLVWCGLVYAGISSFLSWLVGARLVGLNAERYAREADFRFELVRANEEIEGITLYGGEADERDRLTGFFNVVVAVSQRIVRAVTALTWVTAGTGWIGIVAPILFAAPFYFQSGMSFGELMMIAGAFNQMQGALGWFVTNFSTIADWRATLLRVASFRSTLLAMDKIGADESRIELDETTDGSIRFDKLEVAGASGCIMLSEVDATLKAGEHVIIAGEDEHEALLFRAVSGLWPWGRGRIARPPSETIVYMPMPGYVPPGTLRSALTYPRSCQGYDERRVAEAFATLELEHLLPSLDVEDRWDRRLSDSEKHRLNIARVILQRPRWLVRSGRLTGIDPETLRRLEAVFRKDLIGVGVLSIGNDPNELGFFTRTLHIVSDPQGPCFTPGQAAKALAREAVIPSTPSSFAAKRRQ
jgi:putative ATP-binding cassette transporter